MKVILEIEFKYSNFSYYQTTFILIRLQLRQLFCAIISHHVAKRFCFDGLEFTLKGGIKDEFQRSASENY